MKSNTKNSVAERLKMLQKGDSDESFAVKCGVPVSTLRGYLSGARYPTGENIGLIATNLDIPSDWLISGRLLKVAKMSDEQLSSLVSLDPEVIDVDTSQGYPVPVVRTYDNLKHHLQFYCIHCRCWHFHGRGGKDYPYKEGRGGMAGDRSTHCVATNSPFHKHGIILEVVGKLRDNNEKYKLEKPLFCPKCLNYYSAAFNACSCGYVNGKRVSKFPELAALYQEISMGTEVAKQSSIVPQPSNISPAPYPSALPHKIPVISWVQAGDWSEVVDQYPPGFAEDWIMTTETVSPTAFALVVHGDSMEPEFAEGDILTVDPGRAYSSGSYVIVKNGEEATFKQLMIDGSSVYLKPLNNRYPIKDVTGLNIRIVGVVIEKRKRY